MSSGQTSNSLSVLSGGVLTVLSGGTVSGASIAGTETLSGGTDSGAVLGSGGTQTVSAGGFAIGDTVGINASQTLSSGGFTSGSVIRGTEIVLFGGVASSSIVSASGLGTGELVSGGGVVVGTVLSGGGSLSLSGTTSTTFGAGSSTTVVTAAAIASNTTVTSGSVFIYNGGSTIRTTLAAAAVFGFSVYEDIYGGSTSDTTVSSGAVEIVYGGMTNGTTVWGGGTQTVIAGTALNDVIMTGAAVNNSATLAYTETVGATRTFAGNLNGSGIVIQSGEGTLALSGFLRGFTGTLVISGGTLELTSAGAAGSATIDFALSTAGALRIDGTTGPANAISGFFAGDTIDLAGLSFGGNTTPTVSGNTVTISEGTASETLTIAGAAATNLTLASDGAGGTKLVSSQPAPIVSSGSDLTVSSGHTSNGLTVLSGGVLTVLSGGTVSGASIAGTETLSGGTDSGAALSSGGTQTVLAGGLAVGDTVSSGASQTLSAGGLANGSVVRGTQTVMSDGVASGSIVISSGDSRAGEVVNGGGLAVGSIVSAGGNLSLGATAPLAAGSAIAVASNTAVFASGTVFIYDGGVTVSTTLGSAGALNNAAEEIVYGGNISNTTINSGAGEIISGGITSGTIVLSGGFQDVESGTAIDDVTVAGASVYDNATIAYAEPTDTTRTFAGILIGGGVVTQSGGGTLALAGSLGGFTGTLLISGGTLELTSARAGGSATIDFAPASAATLRVDGVAGPSNTISGFMSGDTIDLVGLGFMGNAAPTVSGDVITVTEGGLTETLRVAGAGNGLFRLYPDAAGGTNVGIACYCRDTLILTDRGERPVEALAIGDRVITLSGATEPIRWIGRRSYAGRFLAGQAHLLPIRIRAGALGGGLPRRDLLVSPSHAMFIDGLLIPAGQLVNGTSIAQERGSAAVHYVHVELETHSVIFAEGAPSETYLEDDNRGMFHNAAEFAALYEADVVVGRYCAPRIEDGFALEAVRQMLAEYVAA